MLFFYYPKCGTCRKAKAYLDSRGISYTERLLVEAPPTAEELTDYYHRSGLPLKKFFNTSGQSYRGGGFKDKLPSMTEAEQIAALAADGMLVKRPILADDAFVLVGFHESEWEEGLKNL